MPLPVRYYMIKMVVLVDMEQNLLLTEIMTDNLILSQEGRQSNADGFRLLCT
jgi:hypothetical protein